ncbi:EamA family transporter [Bacillus cereus]|nr:EamA family transporter [Bacillus cereus]
MKTEKLWIADITLLFVAIVWGSSYLVTKIVLEEAPVVVFLFLRFALTVFIMIFFTWRKLKVASKDTWLTGSTFGLLLAGIFISETWGINYTSAANAGFLISLTVVLTSVMEPLLLKKKFKLGLVGAVFLSVIGTFLLTIKNGGYVFNIGDIFILLAAFIRALQMTMTQKLTAGKEIDSGAVTTIQLGIVAIIMGGLSFWTHGTSVLSASFSINFWILTVYLAIFGTLVAFYIQLTMIRKTSPTRVGLLLGTEPVFAALFAVIIGDEHLSLLQWIGGTLIVIATYYGRYLENSRENSTTHKAESAY